MLVLTPQGSAYREVGHTAIVNTPIRLLPTRSKGWRDIGVTVRGGGIGDAYLTALRFDGGQYPLNPSVPPAAKLTQAEGIVLIGPDDKGIALTRQ